jgi:hypothetical protein
VIAEVDGSPISSIELARYARDHEVDARAALEELIALELLAAEAARRGVAPGSAALSTRQAAVRVLLREEFERSRGKPEIPEQLVRDVYKQREGYFVHPPMRVVHNFLVRDSPARPGSEAHRRMQAFVAEARGLPSGPAAVLALARSRGLSVDPSLRTHSGDPRFVPDWVTATMAVPARVGAISDPFPTSQFGWHAVVIVELLPARNTSYAEAASEVRDRIHRDWQRRELEPWLLPLLAQHRVVTRPELLATPEAANPRTPADGPGAP